MTSPDQPSTNTPIPHKHLFRHDACAVCFDGPHDIPCPEPDLYYQEMTGQLRPCGCIEYVPMRDGPCPGEEAWSEPSTPAAEGDDMGADKKLDKALEKQHETQAELGRAQSVNSGQSYEEVDQVPISKDAQEQARIQRERAEETR